MPPNFEAPPNTPCISKEDNFKDLVHPLQIDGNTLPLEEPAVTPRFRVRSPLTQCSALYRPVVRCDRHESRAAGPVTPGVVGPPLYHDFPRFQAHFLRVQDQDDFALQDDTEIERSRFLHVGMRCFR